MVVSRARWDQYHRKMSVQKEEPKIMPLTLFPTAKIILL